jgi:hypothetical protein
VLEWHQLTNQMLTSLLYFLIYVGPGFHLVVDNILFLLSIIDMNCWLGAYSILACL